MMWSIDIHDDGLLVAPTAANLDAAVASVFREEMLLLLDSGKSIVLDFGSVRFIDTSGLGALCAMAERAGPGQLRFEGMTERLARSLARAPSLEPLWKKRFAVPLRIIA